MFTNPPVLLSSALPGAETTVAAAGVNEAGSRSDHAHPRLTSTTVQTLLIGGDVTILFTRTFTKMPGVVCTAYKATDNLPVTFEVKSWIMGGVGGLEYVGCVIHGGKAQTLPSISGIVLLTNLIAALNQFNPFSGDATGTQFSCVAIQASN